MTSAPANDRPLARYWPVLLAVVTALAYWPAMKAGWIWDDDYYVTRNITLRSLDGLRRIWFDIGAVPQYYPLTHTTFWLEWHAWGDRPAGYHVVNVFLHALNAILVGIVLKRLRLPAWWVVPWLFALHPVHVESVAWVTERKNVLSGVFYLLSLLTYLKASPLDDTKVPADEAQTAPNRRSIWNRFYWLSLGLFVCALLSKSVTSSLPAAILLILYWKHGRITRRDLIPLVPFFLLGISMGFLTGWMEREIVGAKGPEWSLAFFERCLIAGRAAWFYATKLFWPQPLIFMYERWSIDTGMLRQWLYPLSAAVLVIGLWSLRHRLGRGPLVAVLFFGGTLLPALGFVNVLPMRYSFVADHFQYLASLGLLALAAGVVSRWLTARQMLLATVVVSASLAIMTFQRARAFTNLETLWKDTLAKNPSSWMAQNNYGVLLMNRGEHAAAAERFRNVLSLKPDHIDARLNLGMIEERQGRPDRAEQIYQEALRQRPGHANALYNLARLATARGQADMAVEYYEKALDVDPKHELALTNLGVLYDERGESERAADHYRRALSANPDSIPARTNLGNVYLKTGRIEEALSEWGKAAALQPQNPVIRNNIATVLLAQEHFDRAEAPLLEALEIDPNFVDALINLGVVRSRKGDAAGARHYLTRALELQPANESARSLLESLPPR